MNVERRGRIVEHRITRRFADLVIRYWIEADPAYGGVSFTDALGQTRAAEKSMPRDTLPTSPKDLASHLADAVPSINSVEVCDGNGLGVAVHRDGLALTGP